MKRTQILVEDINDIIEAVGLNTLLDKLSDKGVLITGASGMIGSYILYVLDVLNTEYNANINIFAVVRNENKLDAEIKNRINIIQHDVVEPFPEINSSIDYIIHAASPASPLIMREHPLETNYANTIGTANTINLAIKKNSRGLLFISSREIYGEPLDNASNIFTEDGQLGSIDHLVPRNGYAEGKKAAENMLASAKAEYGLNTKIVRLAHTYGPGMSIYDGRVQADFLKNIIEKSDIVLKSTGESVRTYTYIADAIKAIFMVLLSSNDLVYNIADEDSKVSIKELAEKLVELPEAKENNLKLVFDIPNETTNTGASSFKDGILSSEKIRKELNWHPKYSITEGFERTINHIKEEMS